MHSCIYEGTVSHRRYEPVTHQFQYRLFMLYLDLDELPRLIGARGLIAGSKYAGCSFLRGDHLFDERQSLDNEVRGIIERETGNAPRGPIRLLTQLRYFGYYFSPLNLFYVFDEQDERLETVVAEVSNTPWNERHLYVLWDGNRIGGRQSLQFAHRKQFHVSPFMGMDVEYQWRLKRPTSQLTVGLANLESSKKCFDAAMSLRRLDLTRRQLRRMTLRYPLMTARISAAIYLQALKLWWKKCPLYQHPKHSNRQSAAAKPDRSATPAARQRIETGPQAV